MKIKIRTKRIIAGMLALFMLFGSIPFNSISVQAATGNVKVDSLGKKGSVSYGSKTKSGTWFQMKVAGKRAFCLSLGKHAIQGIPMRVQKPISGIRIPVERDMVTMPR